MQRSVAQGARPRVSVVLETYSLGGRANVTLEDCLTACAAQTHPMGEVEFIACDAGKEPGVPERVRRFFPQARVFDTPGRGKFEQKNLGLRAATGDIVAMVDCDCVPHTEWLASLVSALESAPAQVAGVVGLTTLPAGPGTAGLAALLYGIDTAADGLTARRLITDNCAFRRELVAAFGFEHTDERYVIDTLFLRRLTLAGLRMVFCERAVLVHDYPGYREGRRRFVTRRAHAVGYSMVKLRQVEPALRGAVLLRAGAPGWLLLCAGKLVLDLHRVWQNRRRLGLRLWAVLPRALAFEASVLRGGLRALSKAPSGDAPDAYSW